MNRRKVLRSLAGLAGVGTLAGIYAWQVEPFWVEFVDMKMPVKNLPAELIGKTLMQISDIHIGKRFDHQYIIDSFIRAQQLAPDFVVYTGDYVTTHKDEVQYNMLKEVLGHLVKGKLGTAAILGNHDYGRNWSQASVADNISEMLAAQGIAVLRNAQTTLSGLNVIGLDDFWGLNFLPEYVMSHYDPAAANILLAHNPDVCDLDIWNGYEGWILSGHTHGGQCRPPFLPAPILPIRNRNYAAGLVELSAGRTLYVNRALGHLWQMRFNVRPEITVFTLDNTPI